MSATARIMVIDRCEQALGRVNDRLTREGYHVITVAEPATAERFVTDCDLVLIDLATPGVDGGELLASLRKATRTLVTQPLFFLYISEGTMSRVHRNLGFDGSIINKGDDESLVQQLATALRFAELRRTGGRPKPRR